MKKVIKTIALVLVFVLMGSVFLAGCNSDSPATSASSSDNATSSSESGVDDTVYTFKIDYPNPENSGGYATLTAWAEKMKEESNGRLEFIIYPSGQLGSILDCVSNCVGGATDGFWSALTIYSGMYRAAEAVTLPMMGIESGKVGSAVLNAMLDETDFYTEEFSNLYVVTLHSAIPMPIGFKDTKSIESLSDMAGLNMRVTGGFNSNWVTAIGCNPVSVPGNDAYEYMEKGIIDSYLYDWDRIQLNALLEQTGYIVDGRVSASELFFCLNKDRYEELPDDLKAILDESGSWFSDYIVQYYDEQAAEVMAEAEAEGITVASLPDGLKQELTAAAEDVWAAWIDDMNNAGFDGQGIFDKTVEYINYFNGIYD